MLAMKILAFIYALYRTMNVKHGRNHNATHHNHNPNLPDRPNLHGWSNCGCGEDCEVEVLAGS